MGVWGEQEWDWQGADRDAPAGYAASVKRLPRGRDLGASLYELPPGATQAPYHFHHGNEELLTVLRGTPTLRTPEGERDLEEGEVVHFPVGPAGAPALEPDRRARALMVSTLGQVEIAEYPDLGQLTAQSRHPSQTGEPPFVIHQLVERQDG